MVNISQVFTAFEFAPNPVEVVTEMPEEIDKPINEPIEKPAEEPTEEAIEKTETQCDESITSYLQRVSERVNSALKQYVHPTTPVKEEKTDLNNEKSNAEAFLNSLKSQLPDWASMKSGIELDETIQTFASQYCEGENFIDLILI